MAATPAASAAPPPADVAAVVARLEENQRQITAALSGIAAALERHAARIEEEGEAALAPDALPAVPLPSANGAGPPLAPALATICQAFRLSPFERDLLLLCAGMELDARFPGLCARAHKDPQLAHPTFGLALAALPGAHWSALTPAAPLRRWHLVEVGAGGSLVQSPLRIDERVLHYLAGVNQADARLTGLVEPVAPPAGPGALVPSHQALAEQIVASWSQTPRQATPPVIQLCGPEAADKRTLAAAACAAVGLGLSVIVAESLPAGQSDLELLMRLWEREAILSASALLLDCEDLDAASDGTRAAAVNRWIERPGGVLLLAAQERRRARQRPVITFEVRKPTTDEQRVLWREVLGDAPPREIERLTAQFDVGEQIIRAASAQALGRLALSRDAASPGEVLSGALWEACRAQARPRLDNLTQRVEAMAAWDDLVLPESQRLILRDIAAHVRQRTQVYERWGFGGKGGRGLGISALFAGASGTGKTTAAEVLAGELHLDLYRIDLSAVVSKYIGETEKNLSRVFDAAEEGGAVLLFDEADALFGKRSEVKDSHDRYANIEVSYLLQRMETYRGLAVLTTNLKSAVDTAFLRRLRFVVQFPFPDAATRAQIWSRIFPAATPTEGLDWEKLARLNVSGGNIKNIALSAAFVAAEAGQPVRMEHVLRAAQAEYAKLEKTLTDAETAGWI